MTLNFDNYDVDIDVEATRRAHSRLPRTSEKCGCAGCRNFTLAIGDALGEGGRRLFASVGVEDPAKATESCVDLPHGDGTFLYGAWYHLCGRIRRRFEAVPDATSAEWGRPGSAAWASARTSASWMGVKSSGGRPPSGTPPSSRWSCQRRRSSGSWTSPTPTWTSRSGLPAAALSPCRGSQFGLDGFPREGGAWPVAEWRGRRVAGGRYHLRGDMP